MTDSNSNLAILALLRNAVEAKVRYWDALHELEMATSEDGEWNDRANDEVIYQIDCLAAGANNPEDAQTRITQEDVEELLETIRNGESS